ALVYMQNSGLGNAINPLTSLVDPEVYNIPILLLIGWRGQPGIKDEPQHIKQGKITLELLDTMGINYSILPKSNHDFKSCVDSAIKKISETSSPHALIAQKGTFKPYQSHKQNSDIYTITREEAIQSVADSFEPEDVIVSTTGKISRELFEYRMKKDEKSIEQDFYTIGSMGHASQIAFGLALNKKKRQVYCLDGDGALIMHMGGLTTIGQLQPKNYKHVVFNNGCHDSVGGQPTVAFNIDIPLIAKACGFKTTFMVEEKNELTEKISELKNCRGPALLEIRVKGGARSDLGRPTISSVERKNVFMRFVQD
ncbi:MAG: phosphonopyruvate decarboxylase, partial [Calditrichae bacterium]|nr:phosphonopyruvate decarboxylase [Calditrichia bacterium]